MYETAVIIPNYNGKHFLAPCLDSVLACGYPLEKMEIIVVDNGSKDGSAEFIQKNYPQVKVLRLQENKGYAGGCDYGVQGTQAEFIVFLNNDCQVHAGWMTELHEAFCSESDIGAVSSVMYNENNTLLDFVGSEMNFYGHGNQIFFHQPVAAVSPEQYPDYLISACGASLLMRRDVYMTIGGYDPNYFAYFEDVDLGWRLWLAGYKIKLAKTSIVSHVHQGTGRFVGDAVKLRLCERNSLITIIKNYEKKNLDRILAPALMLMMKRALDDMCIDKSDYEVSHSGKRFMLKNQLKQYTKGTSKAKLMLYDLLQRSLKWVFPKKNFDMAIIPTKTMARLVALDDIFEQLPRILEQRKKIQAMRKRPDAEIFPYFRNPEFVSFPGDQLAQLQQQLIEFNELSSLWS